MATTAGAPQDALLLFRTCIASSTQPIPTTSSDPTSNTDLAPLSQATHILFNIVSSSTGPSHTALPCDSKTRFISQANDALDLLSVFWCWENREKSAGEYISATQSLNSEREANGLQKVINLVFAEKLDLNNWLSGELAENESEFIKAAGDTAENRQLANEAADLAKGDGDVVMGEGGPVGGSEREAERLAVIYRQERKMGDRNSVLRGVKPTDFSHVRKYTALFLKTSKSAPTPNNASLTTPALRPPPSSKPSRKPEPIILLSPSASSLLRLSNIKSFLTDGLYTPPTTSSVNMLQLTRLLPSIDPHRPTRFILVESPENFKPDYWNRVVAVFTTGQSWQFKGYKWTQPAELFSKVLGVYVGWRNEGVPDAVKGWGRGVKSVGVEYYRDGMGAEARWRDREVVEEIWSAVEASMRAKGFGRS